MKRFSAIAASLFLVTLLGSAGCDVTVTVEETDSCLDLCPEGTTCIEGTCADIVYVCEPECEAGSTCVDGACVADEPVEPVEPVCDPACDLDSTCIEGVCVANEPEVAATGSLSVTNDINWAGITTSFISADITGADGNAMTFDDPAISTGFSAADMPVGEYTVTVTDDWDVTYVIPEVFIEADAESELSVVIEYATSGAINLMNSIDNLDGDEVFVVGLYSTDPNADVVSLDDARNWLEGAELGFGQETLALGVPVGTYHVILADMDDNYYLKADVGVAAGAVTDVTVTADDRDEDLTLALN